MYIHRVREVSVSVSSLPLETEATGLHVALIGAMYSTVKVKIFQRLGPETVGYWGAVERGILLSWVVELLNILEGFCAEDLSLGSTNLLHFLEEAVAVNGVLGALIEQTVILANSLSGEGSHLGGGQRDPVLVVLPNNKRAGRGGPLGI